MDAATQRPHIVRRRRPSEYGQRVAHLCGFDEGKEGVSHRNIVRARTTSDNGTFIAAVHSRGVKKQRDVTAIARDWNECVWMPCIPADLAAYARMCDHIGGASSLARVEGSP